MALLGAFVGRAGHLFGLSDVTRERIEPARKIVPIVSVQTATERSPMRLSAAFLQGKQLPSRLPAPIGLRLNARLRPDRELAWSRARAGP